MFHPLSLYVGLRYVRARSHKFFVSFITWVSLVGVAVGVAALIVILSVMNGLEAELRGRLLSLSAQVRIFESPDGSVAAPLDWSALAARLAVLPGVRSVSPYAEMQVLAVHQPEMLPVVLRGIDARSDGPEQDLKRVLVQGRLEDLAADPGGVVLGRVVADRLDLDIGERLVLLAPVVDAGGVPAARLRELTVRGIFEAGIALEGGSQDHDGSLIFANLATVRALGALEAGGAGLRMHLQDALRAPELVPRIEAEAMALDPALAARVQVRDWTQDHASYFRAVRIEKTMMALILLLVVAVAAFNIVALLVMVVTDKRTDIAILRTLGASPRRVMGVFVTQGLVIGWLGVVAGVLGGVLIARNVGTIVPFLERTFRFRILDADTFYISEIPSVLERADVVTIAAIALVLTVLATVYPAIRAAGTAPAEALRYE